jgi:hypothetical protein
VWLPEGRNHKAYAQKVQQCIFGIDCQLAHQSYPVFYDSFSLSDQREQETV